MQSRLEDVLKQKERELKLYQRFVDLKDLCESQIFPLVDLPLRDHVEALKSLVERLIPDPRDRTEEMFSGEIFALLGTIYLHDIGLVRNFSGTASSEILDNLDSANKKMFMSYGIAKRLAIPEMAIEVINYLGFSNIMKKIPIEWEITEDSKRAIIRNTKVIGHIFNFSHLLLDVFLSDLRYRRLRRSPHPHLILRPDDSVIEINSRQGVIYIRYKARFPYELHVLETARQYVEDAFSLFKASVNGRLGFQYKDIFWDIACDFNYDKDIFEVPRFSPYNEFQRPPFNRKEEASSILDKLFYNRYVVVIGDAGTGKTTVLRSFIIPQILSLTPNVFYCELWADPVNEVRDVICRRHKDLGYSGLDMSALCARLLQEAPCFFVIDSCERLARMEKKERDQFERFVKTCMEQENIYLIVSGDKENFFDWYLPFSSMNMNAVYEIKPIDKAQAADVYSEGRPFPENISHYKPMEFELLQANLNLDNVLMDLLKESRNHRGIRSVVSALVDKNEQDLRRYSIEDIYYETALPRPQIVKHLSFLKEKDILKETEFLGTTYYSLSNRYLKEPLFRVLRLEEFEERRKIRNFLQNAMVNEVFLDGRVLPLVEKWFRDMVFSKEEIGLLLGSLIIESKSYDGFYEKAVSDGDGIDIRPILRLLYTEDVEKRRQAIRLLIDIQDKNLVNPLLLHLKSENVPEIRELLTKNEGLAGKKRAVSAIMNTLSEIGDPQLRLKAVEFFCALFGRNARRLLGDIREREDDPIILRNIDILDSKLGEIQ